MKSLYRVLFLLAAVGASGCDTSNSDSAAASNDDRQPIAKADGVVGSCSLQCGAPFDSDASCQCDEGCLEIGDCCSDYAFLCGEEACTPGEQADAGDACNTCQCDDDGVWSCTELACDDDDACVPGQEIALEDDCNTCTCGEDGRWTCTELGCTDETCTPGEQADAEDACNTCSCDDSGAWSCTELGCEDDAACVPGQEIALDDDCNTCECGDEGRWTCTELAC